MPESRRTRNSARDPLMASNSNLQIDDGATFADPHWTGNCSHFSVTLADTYWALRDRRSGKGDAP
jgi:hypothetical protein